MLPAPLDRIPYHVRGGSVLGTAEPALTTRAVREGPQSLLVALDADPELPGELSAQGELYYDDGGESVPEKVRVRDSRHRPAPLGSPSACKKWFPNDSRPW